MTMTKKGIAPAKPEAQPELNNGIVRHPNWPFREVKLVNPYNTPPDQRFAHNCRSKVPPVIRQVAEDKDMQPIDPPKHI